ncbi:MAG TPA: hypothetical protein VFN42_12010 [Acetobacteraceae bacterium]|nr:hypothetical protein [Acetobacteraceae bacterium]
MYVIAESPIDAIRADFRRIQESSVLHRIWHALATHSERVADRAAARSIRRVAHPGVTADHAAARACR